MRRRTRFLDLLRARELLLRIGDEVAIDVAVLPVADETAIVVPCGIAVALLLVDLAEQIQRADVLDRGQPALGAALHHVLEARRGFRQASRRAIRPAQRDPELHAGAGAGAKHRLRLPEL